MSDLLWHQNGTTTHEVNSVRALVILNKLIDRPVLHPVGNRRTPSLTERGTDQGKNIRMPEVSPYHCLFTKSLNRISAKIRANGIVHDKKTYPEGRFTAVETELHNLDSH